MYRRSSRSWRCWRSCKREAGLCLLFVSHNLAVVQQLCERVLVLYLGRMMELAPAPLMYAAPRHPYTRELIERGATGGPGAAAGAPGAGARRRTAVTACAPERLRVPHALSARARGVRRAHPALGGGERRSPDRLPPLARAAGVEARDSAAARVALRRSRCSSHAAAAARARAAPAAILRPMSEPTIRPSEGLKHVRYEIRGRLARRAHELERQGYEIISLNIGNPRAFGFRTPETMRLAMIENLRRGGRLLPPEGHLPGARSGGHAAAGARRAAASPPMRCSSATA